MPSRTSPSRTSRRTSPRRRRNIPDAAAEKTIHRIRAYVASRGTPPAFVADVEAEMMCAWVVRTRDGLAWRLDWAYVDAFRALFGRAKNKSRYTAWSYVE